MKTFLELFRESKSFNFMENGVMPQEEFQIVVSNTKESNKKIDRDTTLKLAIKSATMYSTIWPDVKVIKRNLKHTTQGRNTDPELVYEIKNSKITHSEKDKPVKLKLSRDYNDGKTMWKL